ncbi:MAG: vesicle formation at the endoplasmic reticulum [Thelocarpon superellum]|nr:MAG: vesicle formation at the endoplasmic reticulum [Thelocarpon superellum]
MRSLSSFLIALCTVGPLVAVQAAPAVPIEIFEQLRAVPDGWSRVGDAQPQQQMKFRIAVKSPRQAEFEQTLLDVSTPEHAKYGQHLSQSELKAMLRPRAASTESIVKWLSGSGISAIEDDGEWINFNTTVGKAEDLLHTDFAWYRNSINGAQRVRTLQYSVPSRLHAHIDMIQPTTRFGQIRTARSHVHHDKKLGPAGTMSEIVASQAATNTSSFDLSSCDDSITPACLKALYNFTDFTADPTNGNKLGIAGYLEEYAKYDDLAAFLSEYAPDAVGDNFTYVGINGGLLTQNDTTHDDVEANLDVQYAMSLSAPVPATYYSTGGRGELVPDLDQPNASADNNEPYLDFLTYMLKLDDKDLPQTLSTSYGEDEQSVPEAYTRTVCNMFAQLGARGVSVIFSSGDTGPGSGCQTNDGKNTTRFQPTFPGACPWVTSVGGTYHVEPEEAIDFSSGGFSERFPRPSYQESDVKSYLGLLGSTWSGLYNPAGRGFPDVSTQASNFHYLDKGQEGLVGGTSAAAPTFAGLIANINSARVSAHLPPMGFLNPFLYGAGKAGLTDITKGTSRGCTGRDIYSGLPAPNIPNAGWAAVAGWDPSTGLGTPNFGTLLHLALTKSAPSYSNAEASSVA